MPHTLRTRALPDQECNTSLARYPNVDFDQFVEAIRVQFERGNFDAAQAIADRARAFAETVVLPKTREDVLQLSLAETSIPMKILNTLETRNLFYVHELIRWRDAELLSLNNISTESLKIIHGALASLGLAYELGEWRFTPPPTPA